MGILELLLIAVGLSLDAFAVSICKGLGFKRFDWKDAIILAIFFGFFQGFMPFIGWLLGTQFVSFIQPIDHWIAFFLLAAIGAKMIYDTVHKSDDEIAEAAESKFNLKENLILAIATSIDALAAGVTFACLDVNIVFSVVVIGCITFGLSLAGVIIGHYFGARFKRGAGFLGGIILIFIGIKILIEHLLG